MIRVLVFQTRHSLVPDFLSHFSCISVCISVASQSASGTVPGCSGLFPPPFWSHFSSFGAFEFRSCVMSVSIQFHPLCNPKPTEKRGIAQPESNFKSHCSLRSSFTRVTFERLYHSAQPELNGTRQRTRPPP